MSDRVVIITGANSGVGLRAALILAQLEYDVILACRNDDRAEKAIHQIRQHKPDAKLQYHTLDLGDLNSVNEFSDWFLSTGKPLYALVNNGGTFLGPNDPRQVSKDGFELTFAVNYLGHFLLTLRLLERMKSSVKDYGESRIVSVASNCNRARKRFVLKDLDLDDLSLQKPGAYSFVLAYKNSKAALIMFTMALKRSVEGTGVTANACSPGFVPSTSVFRSMSWSRRLFLYLADNSLTRGYFNMKTADQGALCITDVVDDQKYKGRSGLFIDERVESAPFDEVFDISKQNKLWELSCDMIQKPEFKNLLVRS